MKMLGPYHLPAEIPEHGPPVEAMREVGQMYVLPSKEVLELLQKREAAREARNWAKADEIRKEVAYMGFGINDTREGPQITEV